MYEATDRHPHILRGRDCESWFHRDSFIGEIFCDREWKVSYAHKMLCLSYCCHIIYKAYVGSLYHFYALVDFGSSVVSFGTWFIVSTNPETKKSTVNK